MVTTWIGGAPPLSGKIFVARGCDRAFTIARRDSLGAAVDYPVGASVYLLIDAATPAKVDAVVSGPNAAFHIQSTVLDTVTNSTKWRAVLALGDNEIPLLTGRFERHDG